MNKLFLLVLIMALVSFTCGACEPEPGVQHFPAMRTPPQRIISGYFTVYNTLNGLPYNEIKSILLFDAVDEKRFVIVGTSEHGLMMFVDENWHTASDNGLFNFPEVTVTSLVKIDDTSFYAGTSAGIFKAKYFKGIFTFEQVATSHQTVLNVNALSQQPEDPKSLLVACDRTTGLLTDDNFVEFSIPKHLDPSGFSAVINSDLGSFVGCNGGLYEINGNGIAPFNTETEQIGWVNSLAKAGNRLFIASSNGVTQLTEKGKLETVLPGIWSTCLAFSADPKDALSGKDYKNFGSTRYNAGSGNRDGMIQEDDPFEPLRQQHAALQRDYQEYTRRFAAQPVADPDAVAVMYGRFHAFNDALRAAINAYAEMGRVRSPLLRGLWIGTQDTGLVLFATNGQSYHLTAENSKLPGDHVTALVCAENGETWVGTAAGGLMRYSHRPIGGKGKLNPLLDCSPTRIKVLADMLAIGTKEKGLHLYDIKTLKSLGHFTDSNVKDFHKKVTDFALDRDGQLWVTGDKGVIVWNGKSWNQIKLIETTDKKLKSEPEKTATDIAIDSQNRIFVAFASVDKVFNQVCFFDGRRLVRTDPAAVQQILAATGTAQIEAIKAHSLSGVYMRNYNFASGPAALNSFETGDDSEVTALLNTEHYLLIGLENGLQKIFDGESYKQLSKLGTGHIGAIVNLFRLPGGMTVIQGSEGISEFNGQHYKLITSPATGPGFKITDMCPDQMNPETYRISFSSSNGGGYARYQETFWENFYTSFPVISMAQADRIIFLASPDGVSYLVE